MRVEDKIQPFTACGYYFDDINRYSGEEYRKIVATFMTNIVRTTPEIRCIGHPMADAVEKTERTGKTYLSYEESNGEWGPINLVIFDSPDEKTRRFIGSYCLYAMHILSEDKNTLVLDAHPFPAFDDFTPEAWAEGALDMIDWFLLNDLTTDGGQKLHFDEMRFPSYFKPTLTARRLESDDYMAAVDVERAKRAVTKDHPTTYTKEDDGTGVGRSIVTITVTPPPPRQRKIDAWNHYHGVCHKKSE